MNVNLNKTASAGDVQSAVHLLRAHLRNQGLRFTSQRQAVLKAALSSDGHFTADQLYETARQGDRDVSLATVYRTLTHLRECGLVREAFQSEGCAAYEAVHGHHDHMLCIGCGRVIEFCDERIEDLQDRICRKHGFEALDHRMGIRGFCSRCRSRRSRSDTGGSR